MSKVTIREMENRVIDAQNSIEMIMMQIMTEYREKIINLNREDQLFNQGITTEGATIGTYSWWTEEYFGGREKGKIAGEPYNFEDTGDLFSGFDLEFNQGYLKIFSTDWKAKMWEDQIDKEGIPGNLQGLTSTNQLILNYEFIRPELIQALKRIIYGAS